MKFFDHTIYASNRPPKFEKTSALSAPSVVDTYQYGYRVNIYSGSESAWTLDKEITFTYDGWNLIQEQTTSGSDVSLTNSAFTQFRTSNYTYIADKRNDEGVKTSNGNGLEEALYEGYAFELIDTAGVVKAHYEYSPFGKLTKEILNSQFVINNSFKFSTKYLDNETQLYYYGHRYYNPEAGRWINRDPINEWGGVNIYGFLQNDILNLYDVLGLSDPEFHAGIKLGFGVSNKKEGILGTGIYISSLTFFGGAKQGLCDNLDVSADVGIRFYSGGVGHHIGKNNLKYEVVGSVTATVGSGEGTPTKTYPFHYNFESMNMNSFEYSLSYSASWYYNSALNNSTRLGTLGFKLNNLYGYMYNDVGLLGGAGTDFGWTGGMTLGLAVNSTESLELGFQDFTGGFLGELERHRGVNDGPYGTYKQTSDQLSLNRAEWYFRYNRVGSGSVTLGLSSPDWLNAQHWIHDLSTPEPKNGNLGTGRFEYPETFSQRLSLQLDGSIKSLK